MQLKVGDWVVLYSRNNEDVFVGQVTTVNGKGGKTWIRHCAALSTPRNWHYDAMWYVPDDDAMWYVPDEVSWERVEKLGGDDDAV